MCGVQWFKDHVPASPKPSTKRSSSLPLKTGATKNAASGKENSPKVNVSRFVRVLAEKLV